MLRARFLATAALAAVPARIDAQSIDMCARRAGLPFTVRAFSFALRDSAAAACGLQATPATSTRLPSSAEAWINTGRASYIGHGPLWLGRGLTLAASGGFSGRWKRASYAMHPVAFWSQNLSYDLSRTVTKPAGDYTDPWSGMIDRPSQFGAGGYGRLDFGDSYVRVDGRWIAGGVSTGRQSWGPGRLQPLVLGDNAGGFPHAFVESGLPWNVLIGRIAGRWIVGHLSASGIGVAGARDTARLVVGAVGTFMPFGLRGVELGATRFFHVYDTPGVRDLVTLTLPFNALLKNRIGGLEDGPRQSNQLASVFMRIAPPASPFEVYGEFMRDDHAVTAREAFVALSYDSAWLLGLTYDVEGPALQRSLTIEMTNGRFTSVDRALKESSMYVHSPIRQGHTLRGMPLGAPALLGGGGLSIQWRRVVRDRGWGAGLAVMPLTQNQEGGAYNGAMSGYYSIEVTRHGTRRGRTRRTTMRLEPGFGDVAGMNVGLGVRVTR